MILIALGSNLPVGEQGPAEVLHAAISQISERIQIPKVESRFFRTPAFPKGSGPDFVNAALKLEGSAPAQKILAILHDIESEFGRDRLTRWAARGLDLDLIAIEDQVLPDLATWQAWHGLSVDEAAQTAPEQLILPHPRLSERGFVLMPLADVAPDWRHPVLEKTVSEMLAELTPQELDGIVPLSA